MRTGYRPVTRTEIARAVPTGSRRLRGRQIERSYLDALTAWDPLKTMRADARDHVMGFAKQLARHASYEDGTTRPTRGRLCGLAGAAVSTWKRARRLLERWGFLALVAAGTTEAFRPMALQRPDVPNTAAVYVLCIPCAPPPAPSSALSGPPTASGRTLVQRPAREAEQNPGSGAGFAGAHPRAGAAAPAPAGGGDAAAAAPAAVAAAMRKAAGQTISDGWSAWIWRPFGAAGWTARDLIYAIDHPPGDRGQHRLSAAIRHPVGWLRWRLGLWLADDGTPWRSFTQLTAASRERSAAEARKFREQTAALRAGRTDAAPWAARIREQMGWKS